MVMAKKINLGLDLQGGMNLVMQADFKRIESKSADKKKLTEKDKTELTQQALELIRNRIDKFGVAEPSIRPRGIDAIEIQLPGVKDPKAVKKAIGTTGRVEYRLVDDEDTGKAGEWLQGQLQGHGPARGRGNPGQAPRRHGRGHAASRTTARSSITGTARRTRTKSSRRIPSCS